MTAKRHLIAAGRGGQPLTPEQRRFNQLLAKIDKARAELQAWDEQLRLFAAAYAERVAPLEAELRGCRVALVARLDELIDERKARWTKADRQHIRGELCDAAAALIEDDDVDDETRERMLALFEKHAGHDYESENRAQVAAMKEMFEAASGLDLGDEEFTDEDALLRHARQRFAEAAEADEQSRPRRKPSAAERRREREQAEASQSLREVFRKLAGALHPDRADGDADRVRRTELMQRVNQAYAANDLLALFSLQLEIEQVDAEHLARASAERARQYNRLLAEQLRDIEGEIGARRRALCADFGLDPMRPLRLNDLGVLLEALSAERRADLRQARRDLEQLADPVSAKALLRERRRRFDEEMPF